MTQDYKADGTDFWIPTTHLNILKPLDEENRATGIDDYTGLIKLLSRRLYKNWKGCIHYCNIKTILNDILKPMLYDKCDELSDVINFLISNSHINKEQKFDVDGLISVYHLNSLYNILVVESPYMKYFIKCSNKKITYDMGQSVSKELYIHELWSKHAKTIKSKKHHTINYYKKRNFTVDNDDSNILSYKFNMFVYNQLELTNDPDIIINNAFENFTIVINILRELDNIINEVSSQVQFS